MQEWRTPLPERASIARNAFSESGSLVKSTPEIGRPFLSLSASQQAPHSVQVVTSNNKPLGVVIPFPPLNIQFSKSENLRQFYH
jgi:hypothetical protein